MISYEFKSGLAEYIKDYLYLKMLGNYKLTYYEDRFKNLDKWLCKFFPKEITITKEMAMEWIHFNSNNLSSGYIRNKAYTIRELAKHIVSTGAAAYVLPGFYLPSVNYRPPHIFSVNEIRQLLKVASKCHEQLDIKRVTSEYIMYYYIMLLYVSGMRPGEARVILKKNVNLDTGSILIEESKGWAARKIVISQDVCLKLQEFDSWLNFKIPNRKYFFSIKCDKSLDSTTLSKNFRKICLEAGIIEQPNERVTLHCLRHTFVSHLIKKWIKNKVDISTRIHYLVVYLGHSDIYSTDYYIHLLNDDTDALRKVVQKLLH